jgi:sugar-specific transcriptional regulator TrmB
MTNAGERGFIGSLVALGLSEKEAAVYVALLKLGRSTVSRLARETGVNRATTYVILDALIAKNLARISGKEPKQEYVAESPDAFAGMMKKKAREMERLSEQASRLALELSALQKMEDRASVRFYEGADGLKQAYEDTLSAREPIRAWASIDDMHAHLQNYFPRYYKRRAEKGIAIRAVFPDTEASRERAAHDAEEARESLLVPQATYRFHPEINVYDNKVMIASWREKLGIIIESAEIADAMKQVYELAWAEAKRLDAASRDKKAESAV